MSTQAAFFHPVKILWNNRP